MVRVYIHQKKFITHLTLAGGLADFGKKQLHSHESIPDGKFRNFCQIPAAPNGSANDCFSRSAKTPHKNKGKGITMI
jgi:hypothetical protein